MNRKGLFAVVLLTVFAGATALTSRTEPARVENSIQKSQLATGSQFLTRNGSKLFLNGKEFHATGANHADLIWSFLDSNSIPENGTKIIEEAANWGMKILRFSAIGCGPEARSFVKFWMNDSTEFWRRYDNVVGNATGFDLYLMPSLVWTTYLCEPFSYITHFNGTDYNQTVEEIRELFDTSSYANELFRNFTTQFIEHYKDNYTILMWEVGNELDLTCSNPNRPNESYTTNSTLKNFLANTTAHIKSLDPHDRPVSSGMAKIPHVYQELNITNTIAELVNFYNDTSTDIISIHTYQNDEETLYGKTGSTTTYNVSEETYVSSFLEASKALERPMIIGEFGDDLEFPQQDDSWFITQVLETTLQSKIPLSLIWEWEVPADRDHCARQIYNVSPTKTPRITKILRDYSVLAQMPCNSTDFNVTWHNPMDLNDTSNFTISAMSNSSISGFQNDIVWRTIKFNVTTENGTGLCRLSMPKTKADPWNGNITVMIDGQPPSYNNTWTNGSHTFIYFAYPQTPHEVIIVPEFAVPVVLPLLMTTTILTVKLQRRRPAR
jgi:hypothetical protein